MITTWIYTTMTGAKSFTSEMDPRSRQVAMMKKRTSICKPKRAYPHELTRVGVNARRPLDLNRNRKRGAKSSKILEHRKPNLCQHCRRNQRHLLPPPLPPPNPASKLFQRAHCLTKSSHLQLLRRNSKTVASNLCRLRFLLTPALRVMILLYQGCLLTPT